MFVPCPHCQFLVTHHPQLQPLPDDCPRCGKPLQDDGEPGFAETAETTDGTQQAGDAGTPPADVTGTEFDGSSAQDSEAIQRGGASTAGDDALSVPTVAGVAPTAFAARPGRWRRWSWPLIALLGLLLALQILVADRARLAGDPRWRPLLETVCGSLGCNLPAWHEPTAFTMLDRKVRPAPQQAGALRVDATFRNDARWSQAWPALQLALSNADGRVLGSRVFLPAEYLGATPTTLLSPGQSAQITFVVQEPAPGTVAFSFEFR